MFYRQEFRREIENFARDLPIEMDNRGGEWSYRQKVPGVLEKFEKRLPIESLKRLEKVNL